MTIEYESFIIEIKDEKENINLGSDNFRDYQNVYQYYRVADAKINPTSAHGILVKDVKTKRLISSALIFEIGGATNIHEKSFFIENYKLWVCINNKIYCLELPSLEVEWSDSFDSATNFSINPFFKDFIVHGELEVFRISRVGEIKWQFGGKDIFVSHTGEDEFQIKGHKIILKDWEGNTYVLNKNGQMIK